MMLEQTAVAQITNMRSPTHFPHRRNARWTGLCYAIRHYMEFPPIRSKEEYTRMKTVLPAAFCLGLLLANVSAHAVDTDAVVGGALGGAAGAAVGSELGGRNGAIAGGAVGAAIGTAIATDGDDSSHHDHDDHDGRTRVYYEDGYDHRGPPPHAYAPPPGHVKHGKKH
jgi:hypothetical protein